MGEDEGEAGERERSGEEKCAGGRGVGEGEDDEGERERHRAQREDGESCATQLHPAPPPPLPPLPQSKLSFEEALAVKYRIASKTVAVSLLDSLKGQISGIPWTEPSSPLTQEREGGEGVEAVEVDAMGEATTTTATATAATTATAASSSSSSSGCAPDDAECELSDAIAGFNTWIEAANFPVQKVGVGREGGRGGGGEVAVTTPAPKAIRLCCPHPVRAPSSARAPPTHSP